MRFSKPARRQLDCTSLHDNRSTSGDMTGGHLKGCRKKKMLFMRYSRAPATMRTYSSQARNQPKSARLPRVEKVVAFTPCPHPTTAPNTLVTLAQSPRSTSYGVTSVPSLISTSSTSPLVLKDTISLLASTVSCEACRAPTTVVGIPISRHVLAVTRRTPGRRRATCMLHRA